MTVKSRHLAAGTAFAVSLCAAGSAAAAEWERSGGVAVAGNYTDNVCLSRDNIEDETFATVTPDLRLIGTGARAYLAVDARLQYNSLAEKDIECPQGGGGGLLGQANQRFLPSGGLLANFEVVENFLTLDADASARQNAINPLFAGGEDGLNARRNNNVSYRYGVGATAQRQFERRVDFLLRYNYNEQFNDFGPLGDSEEHRVEGAIGMTPGTSRLTAGVNGRYSRVEFEQAALGGQLQVPFENTLSSAEVTAALQLSSDFQLNGLVGEEWNDFLSADDIDGEYWDVGLRWTPNTRVLVEVGMGERFFGETPRMQLSYRHKRSRLESSYLRTVQFPRDLRTPAFDPDDPFGPGFGELPGDPVTSPDIPVGFGQGPIQNNQFTLRYSYEARRSTLSLSASDSEQTRLIDNSAARFRNVTSTVSRNLSRKLTVGARLGWQESKGDEGSIGGFFGAGFEAWVGGLDITRRIGTETSITLSWQYRSQTSDAAFNEFDENRIILSTRIALF